MSPANDRSDEAGHEPGAAGFDESAAAPGALRQLTCELRGRAQPELDLDRLEARLFARLDAGLGPTSPLPPGEASLEAPPSAPRARVVRLLPWAALVAAAVALFYFSQSGARDPSRLVSPSVSGSSPGAARSTQVRIATAEAPRRFAHEGLARWQLDPETVAVVAERPDLVTVTLMKGAIEVDVVPNQPFPERFVVVAGKTRVAVRGTRFRVARVHDRVELDVEHGVVAVSSTDRPGEAPAFLVSGPGGGSFALDGDPAGGSARAYRAFGEAGALSPLQAAQAAQAAQAPSAGQPSDPRPSLSMMKPPSPPAPRTDPGAGKGDEAALRARLTSLAADCFERRAHLAPNVSVTVATTLGVEVDASGALGSPRFEPPLAPAVEACFREGLDKLRGAPGKLEIALSLVGRR